MTYNHKDKLRGCIGTFQPDKLGKNLQSYSIVAATKDQRFLPVKPIELPFMTCEISLLTNFEKIEEAFDWEVGKHGIEIEFKDESNNIYRGTYLPHVAAAQGWN